MPISFSFNQIDGIYKFDGELTKLAWDRYKKFPYQLTFEERREIMKEFKKWVKEERKRAIERAKEEAAQETWRMNTEDYLKYILEQREKQRLLKMIKRGGVRVG
jgi:hypothetical protein